MPSRFARSTGRRRVRSARDRGRRAQGCRYGERGDAVVAPPVPRRRRDRCCVDRDRCRLLGWLPGSDRGDRRSRVVRGGFARRGSSRRSARPWLRLLHIVGRVPANTRGDRRGGRRSRSRCVSRRRRDQRRSCVVSHRPDRRLSDRRPRSRGSDRSAAPRTSGRCRARVARDAVGLAGDGRRPGGVVGAAGRVDRRRRFAVDVDVLNARVLSGPWAVQGVSPRRSIACSYSTTSMRWL